MHTFMTDYRQQKSAASALETTLLLWPCCTDKTGNKKARSPNGNRARPSRSATLAFPSNLHNHRCTTRLLYNCLVVRLVAACLPLVLSAHNRGSTHRLFSSVVARRFCSCVDQWNHHSWLFSPRILRVSLFASRGVICNLLASCTASIVG